MKKLCFLLLSCLLAVVGFSQHYYKDLLTVQAANQKHQLNRKNNVKKINFLSFDGEGKPIEGFSSQQEYNRNFTEVVTKTNTTLTGPTENISTYNEKDQLVQTIDSSEGTNTTTTYEYNSRGQVIKIVNTTRSAGGFFMKEVHQWSYNSDGKPNRMLKIKNDRDTTFVDFTPDEKGNVGEEKSVLKGKPLPTVYYYYDNDNNLTDIVRYNNAAKRLLPDYIFEYEDKNRLASMLVVPEGGSDYQKWYYSYDEDGLKILDACYSKTKVLIGRIEYQYEYFK